ncbi:MAG: hypothetical protein ACR2QO_09195 [Acidimicrobiales bacterium]
MSTPTTATTGIGRTSRTWPTLAALALLWAATFANQVWVFGLLFLGWALWDIATGESFFLQRICRRDNPLAFWAIELSWIGFGLVWLLYPTGAIG